MKVGNPLPFWSLCPRAAAARLELGCWLAAGLLALGLAFMPAPNGRAVLQSIAATTTAPAPHVSIYQGRCMQRILGHAAGKTDEAVAALIDRLCFAPFRGHPSLVARQALRSCDQLYMVQLAPAAKQAGGCHGS